MDLGITFIYLYITYEICNFVLPGDSSEHKKRANPKWGWLFSGDPSGTRTPDPLLKRQLLYRLS